MNAWRDELKASLSSPVRIVREHFSIRSAILAIHEHTNDDLNKVKEVVVAEIFRKNYITLNKGIHLCLKLNDL